MYLHNDKVELCLLVFVCLKKKKELTVPHVKDFIAIFETLSKVNLQRAGGGVNQRHVCSKRKSQSHIRTTGKHFGYSKGRLRFKTYYK